MINLTGSDGAIDIVRIYMAFSFYHFVCCLYFIYIHSLTINKKTDDQVDLPNSIITFFILKPFCSHAYVFSWMNQFEIFP